MKRNPSHQKKTPRHLEDYNRAIRRERYEPTIDQSLDFRETSVPGEDLTEPIPGKKRSGSVKVQFEEHIKDHWIAWVVGIVCVGFIFFLVDAKVDFAKLFSRAEQHDKQLERIENDLDRVGQKEAEQDLQIQSNQIRVENLERDRDTSGTRRR